MTKADGCDGVIDKMLEPWRSAQRFCGIPVNRVEYFMIATEIGCRLEIGIELAYIPYKIMAFEEQCKNTNGIYDQYNTFLELQHTFNDH